MAVYYFNITYRCNSNCIFCAANHPLWQDESEMSLEEFKSRLNENHVGENDRVIVNGGEPTIHRDFWKILDLIDETGATIDLFTNGMLFSNEDTAKRILEYENLHLRIPLFGSRPETHDFLTGGIGHFVATTKALDHLCHHIRGHATLEIKLLMSKITNEENEAIYDMITKRWTHPAIRVSLNPLLISECVIQHKDLFVEDYGTMMIKSERLIRKALADGADFSVALVPYCTFPNDELLNMCRGRNCGGNMFYASPGQTKQLDRLEWRKPCLTCVYVKECNGFSQNYISYFGADVMKPVKRT